MTRDEVKKILMIIESAYPNYKPPNKTNAIDVWNLMLEEYTYKQVSVALKSYILSDTRCNTRKIPLRSKCVARPMARIRRLMGEFSLRQEIPWYRPHEDSTPKAMTTYSCTSIEPPKYHVRY